jgi:hypothetical protein
MTRKMQAEYQSRRISFYQFVRFEASGNTSWNSHIFHNYEDSGVSVNEQIYP